jgi:hypothetical protein
VDCEGRQVVADIDDGWVLFCKRTNEPKLSWIEMELGKLGIPYRRSAHRSFHADFILEVPKNREAEADAILMRRIGRYTVDDIRDDHPRWERELAAAPGPDEEEALGGREFWS